MALHLKNFIRSCVILIKKVLADNCNYKNNNFRLDDDQNEIIHVNLISCFIEQQTNASTYP